MADQTPANRRGRKPVQDKDAPHGRDAAGKPLAPHGLLPSGKPRVNPERTTTLDPTMLATPLTDLPPAVLAATKRVNPRSAAQKAMDGVVKGRFDEWVKAGKPKPSEWGTLPKAVYRVKDPREVEQIKFLAKKAAAFLRCRIIWGRDGVRDQEGRTIVAFAVVNMVEKKKASK